MKTSSLLLLIFLFFLKNTNAQINLTQGLVAYYPFNGNANDESGNNINGIVNGAILTTDSKGSSASAFRFNGSNAYISLPFNNLYDFKPSDSFSISTWVQPNSKIIAGAIVVKSPFNTNWQASNWNYGLYTLSNTPMTGWAANNFLNASTQLQNNKCWSHLVVTYKNGIWKLYVNKNLEAQDNSQTNFIIQDGAASTIAIGRKGESYGDYFDGKIDEIRIYNRNLNNAEVDSLFIKDYDKQCWENKCNTWLKTPTNNSYVEVGDVDVTGTSITVEANYNRTQALFSGLYPGHLVSKHTNTLNGNYELFPNGCAITTTDGYFETYENCPLDTAKTYQVAMVYDGSTLKFYRNGFLHSSKNCTGNMVNNNLNTTIGQIAGTINKQPITQFLGNINEVRIWNVARTQQQIQQYMNDTLPNPTTQNGLLGYYTFNSLKNKQGNNAFDGVLTNASINETNPQCSFVVDSCGFKQSAYASFTLPDTVCVNQSFTINNTSTNATTYNWNFCTSDFNAIPIVNNLGNPGSNLSTPVFMDYVNDNGNFYGFIVNHNPSGITRLDFGNSLLNTPTSVFLGNLKNGLWQLNGAEDIKIINENGIWIGLIVGGDNALGTNPSIRKIDFGSNITNLNPIVTNWGNVGNMDQPHELYLWKENGNCYGLVFNSKTNTITRFSFGNSFSNNPVGINLGNIGSLNYPSNFEVLNDNGVYRIFVTNCNNNTISRLDFGNSLLNTPTSSLTINGTGFLNTPRGLRVIDYCKKIMYINNQSSGILSAIEFNGDWSNNPTIKLISTFGLYNGSHCYTKPFTVANDKYIFSVNAFNHNLLITKISGCSNSSLPSSTLQSPPQISYNTTGTYNINLTVDEGLSTQSSFCKQIEVINCDTPLCKGAIELHQFDGVTLQTPQTKYFPATGFTWETWFKFNNFDNTNTSIATNQLLISAIDPTFCEDIALGFGWAVGAQSNELSFIVDGNGQCSNRDNNPCKYKPINGFVINKWYHVAAVKDYTNNTTKLYLNGDLVDTKANNNTSINRNLDAQIGRYIWSGGTVNSIDGEMDEIRFWNIPRHDSDIKKSYNKCLQGNENGLVSYYKCNERKDNLTLKDYSINKFNAAMDYAVVWQQFQNAPIGTPCEKRDSIIIDTTICQDSSFLGYNIAGTYRDTFYNKTGCDSIRILHLKLKNCDLLNPSCLGTFVLKGSDRVTPPQANFKKYIPSTGFTWECWFNGTYFDNNNTSINTRNKLIAATDIPSTTQDIVLGFGWPGVAQKRELCFVADGPNGNVDRDNNPCKYFPTGGFIANKWYHVAAVRDYNNNISNLYIDGILVDSKPNNHNPLNPNSNLLVPNFYFGSMTGIGATDSAFPGKMDEIRLWNYPRTAAQIQTNFNQCINAKENGLVAYYHSNSLKDATTNANNVTLSNGATISKTENAPLINACFLTTYDSVYKSICFGTTYQNHSSSGIYKDTTINSTGCDSITILYLTVLPNVQVVKDTLENCKSITLNGIVFTKDTLIKDAAIKYIGLNCDSLIKFHQILITPLKSSRNDTICQGKSFWGRTISSTFDSTFKTLNCDSVVTVNLLVTPSNPTIEKDALKDCGRVFFNGQNFYKDTLIINSYKNIQGCDSVVIHTNILIQKKASTLNKHICIGQNFWGRNTTSTFDSTFKLANNCDSIVTVNLTVVSVIRDTTTSFVCFDSIPFNIIKYDTIKTIGTCDSIKVTFINKSLKVTPTLQQDTSICKGDSILLFPGNYKKYLWSTNAISPSIKVKNENTYWVKVIDSLGCKGSDSFTLLNTFNNPANFFVQNPYESCLGQFYPLQGFKTYDWSNGETTNGINLNGNNSYWVTVTDFNNCKGKDTLFVTYTNKLVYDIPSAFSPNNDGINDEFKPFNGSSCLNFYNIQIFNRWGQKVFEKNSPSTAWNGKSNGRDVPSDVYYYVINFKTITGISDTKSGYVTLLR